MASKPRAKVSLTADRLTRLYKLITLLSESTRPRELLMKKTKVNNIRVFYRDIKTLRNLGIPVESSGESYSLPVSLSVASASLPFPDPGLSFHEILTLAEGRGEVHKKLRSHIQTITGGPAKNGKHG
jgi:biotin operon repressor